MAKCRVALAQIGLGAAAHTTAASLGIGGALSVATAIQGVSWTGQVGVGHWLIERNHPGMATSLTMASVVLSPLLTWYDVLGCIGEVEES